VAIVGVEGGRSFTTNPCLLEQFQWANATGHQYEVYLNTNFPAGSTVHRGDQGPKGVCQPADWACKAYNYGFNNAEYALHYAQTQHAVASTWWLDVETANSWSDQTAWNDQVIQGAADSLRAHQLQVGIYSIPPMWKEIAGNYVVNLPKWVVQLRDSVPATAYCAPDQGFGGGAVALVQVEGAQLDQDYACPTNAFATQAGYVPLPLTGPLYGEVFGTHGGISTFYALSPASTGASPAVTFDFSRAGADVANALFLTVTQNNLVLASARGTDTATPGHLRLPFSPAGPAPITIRVQSYNPANTPPVSYTVSPG
jgi:hypothetical protein